MLLVRACQVYDGDDCAVYGNGENPIVECRKEGEKWLRSYRADSIENKPYAFS